MTTATTILALIPILTSTGRGADIMVPMAIPSIGGMVIENLGGKGMANAASLTTWVSHDKKNWKQIWQAKKPERTWEFQVRHTSCPLPED